MATATWDGLEVMEGIVMGAIHPETLPFAQLDVDAQKEIIERIDAVSDDIKAKVLADYPDLEDEAQRNDRLRRYRDELLARTEAGLRDSYAGYFDVIMGVCIKNANSPRSYTIDDSGCIDELISAA
jgi:hypothetical protein